MKLSLAVAAILLSAYSLFLTYGPRPHELVMQSQWQDNNQITEAYFRKEMHAPVVFVGSSLSRRLKFDDSSCMYNLALGGDSSLTGLLAILQSDHRPKKVFIEINEPNRNANAALVEASNSFYKKLAPIFYTENMPANLFYSFLVSSRKKSANEHINETARTEGVALQSKDYHRTIPQTRMDEQIDLFANAIQQLEKRGIEVTLYELPISRELRNSPKEQQILSVFSREFPNNKLISANEIAVDVLSTDGIHMTADEAKKVSERLHREYASVCRSDV